MKDHWLRKASSAPQCHGSCAPRHSASRAGAPAPQSLQRGFSLLEVLLAVVLFALASVLAYGGLRSIVSAQSQEMEAKSRLGRLQFAIGLIERDVASAARRGVRDTHGAPLPAFEGGGQRFELTRFGLANALMLPRAELERVAYLRRDDQLLRLRWSTLDRAPGARAIEDELLDGVDRMELVFLDAQGREHRQWPPQRGVTDVLPQALRLTLDVRGFGSIRRVLELPSEPIR